MHRRGFLLCLTGIIAAPAIVKASSLMPLRAPLIRDAAWDDPYWTWRSAYAESEKSAFDFATIGLDEDGYDATIGAIANNALIIIPKRPILVA